MSALARKGHSRFKRDHKSSGRAGGAGDARVREPFVDLGLQHWTNERDDWLSAPPNFVPKPKTPVSQSQRDADAEELYNALLTPNYQPLPRKVPLSELVGILQEVRELST